ncbi:MAG: truB [Actinomycetia bacterium]|nr:truB [Actinomycetes bacterium]
MPDGFAVVDKQPGWTSHDVVAKARGILGTKKVGHAGTLDPDATGVLLLGVGKVTRLLRFFSSLPKTYVGEVVLGTETNTLDSSGEVTARWEMRSVTPEEFREEAAAFVGDIEQIPPMVSAVKVGGKRLHELARAGIEVERESRPVTIHRLDVETTDDPLVYRIEVECSSGTYIRTLAADIGRELGGGAHLRNLRRTAIGPHTLAEAHLLEDIQLLSPAAAVAHLAQVTVDGATAALVAQGRKMDLVPHGHPVAVLSEAGDLLAVYEKGKPEVVLIQPADVDHQ